MIIKTFLLKKHQIWHLISLQCLQIIYAALTPRQISLEIWKFEIRGKIAENDMIGKEKCWNKWGLMNACKILMNPNQSLLISYRLYDL